MNRATLVATTILHCKQRKSVTDTSLLDSVPHQFKRTISGLRSGPVPLKPSSVHVNKKFVPKWTKSVTWSVEVNNKISIKAGYWPRHSSSG
jgi:hypothetical protein